MAYNIKFTFLLTPFSWMKYHLPQITLVMLVGKLLLCSSASLTGLELRACSQPPSASAQTCPNMGRGFQSSHLDFIRVQSTGIVVLMGSSFVLCQQTKCMIKAIKENRSCLCQCLRLNGQRERENNLCSWAVGAHSRLQWDPQFDKH